MSPTPMTKEAASHIQSTQAKGGNDMSSKGFAARAQGAGDRNANAAAAGNTGNNYGGNSNTGTNNGAVKK